MQKNHSNLPSSSKLLTWNRKGRTSSWCMQNRCQFPVRLTAISRQDFKCSTNSTRESYGKDRACWMSILRSYPPLEHNCLTAYNNYSFVKHNNYGKEFSFFTNLHMRIKCVDIPQLPVFFFVAANKQQEFSNLSSYKRCMRCHHVFTQITIPRTVESLLNRFRYFRVFVDLIR